MLYYHNLLQGKQLKNKKGIMSFIHKVGSIQFDPLNVIAMNPHLVLQSRIKNYKKKYLLDLLYKDRVLMDGWDKCMSIYPIEDRPYFLKHLGEHGLASYTRDKRIVEYLPEVRKTLTEKGPCTSSDIKFQEKMDWFWAPTSIARAALEYMFYTGELTIYNKIGTRRIYDFSKNHLPDSILNAPDPNQTDRDYFKWGLYRRIKALGLLWNKRSECLLGIKDLKSKEREQAFIDLLEEDLIRPLHVEGLDETFYYPSCYEHEIEESMKRYKRRITFIAPLDNFIWDRPMIEYLFDFRYRWEVYTPKAKREYGYYVLPIIYGDQFLGRFEPRFDKKTNKLIILNLWIESKEKNFEKPFKKALKEFMVFLGADDILIDDEAHGIDILNDLLPLEELNGEESTNGSCKE
jgi:uncharacterized protein YcaQ